ncbi:uncharacterized protein LOC108465146 [Gossypium arboreum]|uniref:uncharacterized protein LOC108465146 n=1 Tax=Gossypium arboreum TaxID=29729 RepID=UPI0008195277|nr:uncharacterized protein LOC108465146 [Gossypium arboreum]
MSCTPPRRGLQVWVLHELLKYYDCTIQYHPGKAYVVVDGLSRNSMSELRAWVARLSLFNDGGLLMDYTVEPHVKLFEEGKTSNFAFSSDGVLCYCGRFCMPSDSELSQSILREAHSNPYAMHLRGCKMYRDFFEQYWWPRLKRDVMDLMARCLMCQQVKA